MNFFPPAPLKLEIGLVDFVLYLLLAAAPSFQKGFATEFRGLPLFPFSQVSTNRGASSPCPY